MNKKSLLKQQIIIVLYLLAAAISVFEASEQFAKGGFGNWRVYFFAVLFLFCIVMYFVRKKQRWQDVNKPQDNSNP
jgi:hypothetical protein